MTDPRPSSEPTWAHATVRANGQRFHLVEQGSGPLVLLIHGFPESWHSWSLQIPALAAAGYRVAAPDMRGYGRSSKPREVEAYDIEQLVGDCVGIVEALGEREAIIIGHDWGLDGRLDLRLDAAGCVPWRHRRQHRVRRPWPAPHRRRLVTRRTETQ